MADEIYQNLPRDPEEAFLILEEKYRAECEVKINNADQNERTDVYYTAYIARVLGAIAELGLETAFDSDVPRIEDVSYSTYLNFSKDVEHYRTILAIRHGRRVQGYSVKFDSVAKEKLRHHLRQMRELVDSYELDQDKRESLFAKINSLQEEIDRDRTRLDTLADLSVTVAGMLDTTLEPINKLLTSIARIFWGAQREEMARLPPPKPRKQIEGPSEKQSTPAKPEASAKRTDLDDEIPF